LSYRLADTYGVECRDETTKFRQKYFTDRHASLFHTTHDNSSVAQEQIVRIDFELRGNHLAEFHLYFSCSHAHGIAHVISRTASGGDRVIRGHVSIGLNDVDALRCNAQFLGNDLSHRRLWSRPHRPGAAFH